MEIKKYIEDKKVDLVVMGTQGASGLKDFMVGSNAEKIVRSSTVPVISIKKIPKAIKQIVFPTRPDLEQEELAMHVKDLQSFFRRHVAYTLRQHASFI